jgi:hypothetical protein
MKTIHKNESGFAVIESLIIGVVLIVMGGVGLYVWHLTQNNRQSKDFAAKAASAQPTPNQSATLATAWHTYKNEKLSISFDYPATWQISTKEVADNSSEAAGAAKATGSMINYIYVESPDFVAEDPGSPVPAPAKGAAFGVFVSPNKAGWLTVTEATQNTPGFGSPTRRQIDGLNAVTGAEAAGAIATRVLRSGNYVDLSYYFADGQKDLNFANYQKWLDSAKLQASSFTAGN